MTKDIKQYVEQAKTLSDLSTQNRDINKLAALMMIEDMLEEIHAELQKINAQPKPQKTVAQKKTTAQKGEA